MSRRRLTDGATVRFVRDYTGPISSVVVPAGAIGTVRAVHPDTGRVVVAVPIGERDQPPTGRAAVAVTVDRRTLRVTHPAPADPFVTFTPRGARS